MTATLDGRTFLDRPAQPGPDMLATDLDYGEAGDGIEVAAGEHELAITLEVPPDEVPSAYVVPAATGRTDEPGDTTT